MATLNRIDEINLEESFGELYQTGYQNLDYILKGFKEGTVITVGARPAMGKTNFVNNVVIKLLEKYNLPTLYISLDANKEITATKLSAISAGISYMEIRNKQNVMKDCIEEFKSKQYNLYISDDCINIQELEELIEENRNIRLLVIDYIQLMRSNKEFSSATDLHNDTIDRIRILATKYKLIVILISQLSRQVEYREDKRPMLADLRSSGNLENNSDIVILLYRASYYNSSTNKNMNEIIVSKNRYGSTGISYLEYDENKSKLIEY